MEINNEHVHLYPAAWTGDWDTTFHGTLLPEELQEFDFNVI